MVSYLASESMLKAFMMAALGMMLGMVGVDPMKGTERFSYGIVTLMGGIGVVPVVMGIFGIPEVFENIEHSVQRELIQGKIKGLLPTVRDWKDSIRTDCARVAFGLFSRNSSRDRGHHSHLYFLCHGEEAVQDPRKNSGPE